MLKTSLLIFWISLSTFAASPEARISLEAQLWKRPLGASNRLKITRIGRPELLEASLRAERGHQRKKIRIESPEVSADVSFLLVLPKAPERPFVVTQVQVFHPEFGMIAECSNYDSIEKENAPGVGACSGGVDGTQFGLSLSAVSDR